MRIAVFSDTHEMPTPMKLAIAEQKPDMVIHLGDYVSDIVKVMHEFDAIPYISVAGNCDVWSNSSAPLYEVIQLGSVKAFITHGHVQNVKYGISNLVYTAQEKECQLALFGHTHQKYHEDIAGVKLVNPGTAGFYPRSYAMLEILDNGGIKVDFMDLPL